MVDNVDITAGTGTAIAADDVGGVFYQRVKLAQGADGSATDVSSAAPLYVTAGGNTAEVSANFTRPSNTTAYASGDLVANNTVAGSVTPLSFTTAARISAGSGAIRRARLKTSSTSTTNASFRLHLYNASPTVTNGDNGAWLSIHSGYLGAIDIAVDKAFSDAANGEGSPNVGGEINFKLSSGQTIYGLLEARAAYTPTSAGVFTVILEILQD